MGGVGAVGMVVWRGVGLVGGAVGCGGGCCGDCSGGGGSVGCGWWCRGVWVVIWGLVGGVG